MGRGKKEGESLGPELVRQAHPRLRVDLLRKALRAGEITEGKAEAELSQWISLFEDSFDPSLMVLILELLEPIENERVVELARRATHHRGDGVRLEGLRMLMDRRPLETPQLSKRHREDYSLEVRLLVAERLVPYDRNGSVELCMDILDEESGGLRMGHAIERVCELFVEMSGLDLLPRLREAQEEYGHEDPEEFFQWARDRVETGD